MSKVERKIAMMIIIGPVEEMGDVNKWLGDGVPEHAYFTTDYLREEDGPEMIGWSLDVGFESAKIAHRRKINRDGWPREDGA